MNIEQLKDAFRKLLSYTYFDKSDLRLRHDVAVFARSLAKHSDENQIFELLLDVANGERQDCLESWLSKIELCFYPKKTKPSQEQSDEHFVTNIPAGHAIIERLLVKASFPVELMILDTAWLLEYGHVIDAHLKDASFGNRLDLTLLGDKVRYGNTLFKKYTNQYKKWWYDGLNSANNKLKDGQSVSIVNFDITDCYHSINFDFDDFFAFFLKLRPESDIKESPLTKVIVKVYERYWSIVRQSDASPFNEKNKGKNPMPLSLLSAHVLANWYLSPLDDYLLHSYPEICYYGRYVDDCMIVIPSNTEKRDAIVCCSELFPGLFVIKENDIVFGFANTNTKSDMSRLSNFCIQKDKLYVYHFDCELPQESLEKFRDEQRERSSEYRFLTDEFDHESGQGLEFSTLVKSLDPQEKKGRRFDVLEENRYKLSVFLAKLNHRLAKFGERYEHIEEVDKVFKFFRSHLLIKHYMLWEKMFTAFVLSEKKNYVELFYGRIHNEIIAFGVDDKLFTENKNAGKDNIKRTLVNHLYQSVQMAISLHTKGLLINTLYLDTFMVRSYFNQFPLQEFAKEYHTYGVRLPMTKLQYNKEYFEYRWMPYYVKYYDIASALIIGQNFDPNIYKKAYKIFKSLNYQVQSEDEWKVFMHKGKSKDEWEFNTSFFELPPPEKLIVSVIEMDSDERLLGDIIDSFGSIDYSKVNLMRSILDKITTVTNTDIFMMPELTLPLYELHEFCQYSAKNEKAFIAGMEYVVKNGIVYNYVVTCLPIILYGQNDAIPIIRLKNYYAPGEYNLIEGEKKLRIPSSKTKWKILCHWKGHVFTNFYCYELTSIKDRGHFLSLIDAMYCSVLNRDTHYFNSIAESCSRDLHCFFIMSNISRYGDSRVTQPSSRVTMNIMRVKGGNTDDNKAVVLSSQLDIKALRNFQKWSLGEQLKTEPRTFKITPPDFDKSKVDDRIKRFLLAKETNPVDPDFLDDFIANMYLNRMKPIM